MYFRLTRQGGEKVKIYAVILGAALTPFAIQSAAEIRGYDAVGGEYLLMPLFLLIACLIAREVRR